ncbi:MAG: helix-turn-helix domain-containing protein [Oscillospiraceae bacterium]|nr:helix-turn-helix domain-containing protein [Oscillospiraceae bacterium]
MNALLERYIPLVTFLGETLPDAYEILLLDLTEQGMPVVAQHNARRTAAQPLRRYLKTILNSETVVGNGMLTNRSDVMRRDKLDKTSILLLKDEGGVPVGALALSVELGSILAIQGFLGSMLTFNHEDLGDILPREVAASVPEAPTLDTIDQMRSAFTDQPGRLTPEEKTELIVDLYDAGVFELKGAVARAALALGMSEQSIYRYLAKIRRARGE